MSFSDMMASGRGPGVIGMVMALVVLMGFGLLFMFAADEGFQGGDQSIESVVAHQAKEIESSKASLVYGQNTLLQGGVRIASSKEFTRLNRENRSLQETVAKFKQKAEEGRAEVARRNEALENYKNQYRAHVRGMAKGQTLEVLETRSGVAYKNVSIREVTAVGLQIRHDDGQKRIPFEDLPDDMIEHFQFDPKQKAAAIASEEAARNEHEAAVMQSDEASDRKASEQAQIDAEVLKEKNIRTIAIKESRIRPLSDEIELLAEAIPKEKEKRMSRAPQMREQLAAKKRELAALQADIARMRAGK